MRQGTAEPPAQGASACRTDSTNTTKYRDSSRIQAFATEALNADSSS